ncbi:MAG: SagB/ThcOx family dehydrogenase, partial [Anaerolineales bacterium]
HYLPEEHVLNKVSGDDIRIELSEAALNQEWMADAPAIIVITGIYARSTIKYGDRTMRYIFMDVGAVSENVYLQAESLGLGTVLVGAFYELKAQSSLDLPDGEIPLGLMPVGCLTD